MGVRWTPENARFRSVIVRQSDNFVVSQGFRKFTNLGETPSFEPWDPNWPVEATKKMDGSLLIVSKYKGNLIIRTRGAVDTLAMDNNHEIGLFMRKYNLMFESSVLDDNFSILLEWTSPDNIVVLKESDEPELTLLAIIDNTSGNYSNDDTVSLAAGIWCIQKAKTFVFNSLEECVQEVKSWEGSEGVVIRNGQTLKKIKSTQYLDLHRMASSCATLNGMLDVFMNAPVEARQSMSEFVAYVEAIADFEIAHNASDLISTVINAYLTLEEQRQDAEQFVQDMDKTLTRPEEAKHIIENLTDWKRVFAFNFLNGKEMEDPKLRKAIESIIK